VVGCAGGYLGVCVGSALLALLALSGCGSSGAHARMVRPRFESLLLAVPLISQPGQNPRYARPTQRFCAVVDDLPQFNVGGNMKEDWRQALAEGKKLARVRRALASVVVPRARRRELSSYVAALENERELDERIAVDAVAAEDSDVRVALEQHTFNSRARSQLAHRLGIGCLVQLNPT
jgi:hypothetical protein